MRTTLALPTLLIAGFAPVLQAQSLNSGDLYIVSCQRNDPIYVVDPVTYGISTFVPPSIGCSAPIYVPASADRVLATDFDASELHSYDASGNKTVVLTGADGLLGPWGAGGILQDSAGNYFVGNWSAAEILKFDSNFAGGTVFADASDGISSVDALAIDASDHIFVGGRGNSSILDFAPDGTSSIFDPLGESATSIVFEDDGDMYVATDLGNIYRYAGGIAANRALLVSGLTGCFFGMAFDPDDTVIYLTDLCNGNLSTVDPDTGALTEVIAAGGLPGCYGIAVVDCKGRWSNYGVGFPGTNGVPGIALSADPLLGTTIDMTIDNSRGTSTVAALFLGVDKIDLTGSWGGSLLVQPMFTIVLGLPGGGGTLSASIPDDDILCDYTLLCQVLELDPGAAKNLSNTPGLEVHFGR